MYAELSDDDSDEAVYGGGRKRRSRGGSRRPADEDVLVEGMDEDDDDDDDEVFGTSKRARQQDRALAKKRRKLRNADDEDLSGYAAELRFSTRNSKVVNYALDDDSDAFEEEMMLEPGDESGWDSHPAEQEAELGKNISVSLCL
jgi:chromodomain-helicase-DNA-binding protein 1